MSHYDAHASYPHLILGDILGICFSLTQMTPALTNTSNQQSIWIVEDDTEYLEAISFVLCHSEGMKCAAKFSAFEEVIEIFEGPDPWEAPDLVLLDIGLPGMNGIEAIAALKEWLPEVPIVMLTISDSNKHIYDSLRAGAHGYLLKDTPIDKIIVTIREAITGGMLVSPEIASRLLEFFSGPESHVDYALTDREKEVLRTMAVHGLSQKEIADELNISTYTVVNHCRSIYKKLHVHSGIQAVSKAFKEGLL